MINSKGSPADFRFSGAAIISFFYLKEEKAKNKKRPYGKVQRNTRREKRRKKRAGRTPAEKQVESRKRANRRLVAQTAVSKRAPIPPWRMKKSADIGEERGDLLDRVPWRDRARSPGRKVSPSGTLSTSGLKGAV